MTDDERETLITDAYDQLVVAPTVEERRKHWIDLVYHVHLRSPEQIMKLESERRISEKYAKLFTYDMNAEHPADAEKANAG